MDVLPDEQSMLNTFNKNETKKSIEELKNKQTN